ncbi:DNA excision repair protein ERCC-6-like 2 [Lytechinus variegatus]|uniref:DNA excision repair protein ERCC-6-like 2 n=1 Tax=Lytechinus variegatus TaxID=7654 RepID=UPI001BB29695|nr:DNA excision repair protein ERCC-6-like 2 [Lytechinus variegatus]
MEGKWSVGDKCMAPYSGDSSLYKAVILKLEEDGEGCKMAEVQYKGFSSEDNELVYVEDLKDITRSKKLNKKDDGQAVSFESPLLNYISEEDRIRAQYADMYDDPRPVSRPTSSASTKKCTPPKGSKVAGVGRKRKGAIAFGGAVKASSKSVVDKARKPSQPVEESSNIDRKSRDEWNIADLEEGFSATDVEKPNFPGKSDTSSKESLTLSSPGRRPVIQVPGTINRYLREYQREGIKFLFGHYKNDRGAILGDDMGLGKTVQVIAFIAAVLGMTGGREDLERRLPEFLQRESPQKSSSKTKTFLIICPNSVLYNWMDEFETWTHCLVARYHGKEREDTLRKARRGRLDAVLTTYETYRLYLDDLLTVSWDAVFVDEVHKIKEPSALITQALKEISTNKRYGLTGTALQNKMGELWCVLDWANPDCLGGWREFKQEYEQVITTGQKYNASKRELADARQVAKKFAALRSKWMIRRTKSLIAHQLPTKDENVVFCKLSSFQLDVYRALLESDDMKLVLEQKNPCDCRSGLKRGRCCYKQNDRREGIKSLTFGLMSLLIKVSNHISLLMPDASKSKKQREKSLRYCEIAFAKQPQFVELSREARFATLSDPTYCGKMQVLEKLLRVFKRENNKVLLFSSYTQLLDILEMFMKTTFYTYRRLDGKTPVQDRQKFVHEFNKDPDIFLFLISTKAGGIGLNLTGANVVVIFDPNWNPTHDLQAQDRAYRIGQHRDVKVYRLISRGSIEENMYLRQVYKQQLASVAMTTENAKRYFTAVAGDKEQQGEIFGLQNLFALRADGSCLTKDVIQREEKTELGISMAKYKPQTSVDESPDDPLDELLQEDVHIDVYKDSGEEEDDEDDDVHGMASQLLEDDDEGEDDIASDSNSDVQNEDSREDSKKIFPKTSKTKSSHRISHRKAGNHDNDDDGGAGWRDQLRKLTRGKAILGKDGQPVRKVKGQCSKSTDSRSRTTAGDDDVGGDYFDDDDDEEEERGESKRGQRGRQEERGTARKRRIVRIDSGNIKTAEDVFKKCGVEYVHSNQKVVGGSHVEDHVSKVAQRDVFEIGQFSQEPAYCQVPTLDVESITRNQKPKPATRRMSSLSRMQSSSTSHRLGDTTLLVGQTPIGIRRDQFADMASVLDFKNPSALASHIQGLSDEGCLHLLLSYNKSKYGVDFDEFVKLPTQPSESRKALEDSKAGKEGAKRSSLSSTRSRGRGKVRRDTEAKRSEVARGRGRKAAVGLEFESRSSDDSFNLDSDDIEVVHPPVKKRNSRTKPATSGRGKERRRGRRIGGMMSHEVYQELFDDDSLDEFGVGYDDLKVDDKSSKAYASDQGSKVSRKAVRLSPEDKKKINERVESNQQSATQESSKDSSLSTSYPKRQENLSFLDDIFLSDAQKPRRRPPPKKHAAKRATAMSELDYMFEAESITDDSRDPYTKVSKVKGPDGYTTPGAPVAAQPRVTFDTDVIMETVPVDDNDGDLWKRNETFLPRQTYFEESEESEDSQSLFAINPKFKSGSGAIT